MAEDHERGGTAKAAGRFLGSLRDALAAASREDEQRTLERALMPFPPQPAGQSPDVKDGGAMRDKSPPLPSAADAAKEARGGTPIVPPLPEPAAAADGPPTTRAVRGPSAAGKPAGQREEAGARTTLVRGKAQVKREEFHQDPVVGWLVVVGGPGLGSFRPVFEGNNTLGRAPNQRIPVDFGDDAISSEEQAYVRYDSTDRSFLFVPNLAKTNVVSVNDKRPTGAVPLAAMDVITVGRTQLVFVPFCGPDFDWSALTEMKS